MQLSARSAYSISVLSVRKDRQSNVYILYHYARGMPSIRQLRCNHSTPMSMEETVLTHRKKTSRLLTCLPLPHGYNKDVPQNICIQIAASNMRPGDEIHLHLMRMVSSAPLCLQSGSEEEVYCLICLLCSNTDLRMDGFVLTKGLWPEKVLHE